MATRDSEKNPLIHFASPDILQRQANSILGVEDRPLGIFAPFLGGDFRGQPRPALIEDLPPLHLPNEETGHELVDYVL